MDSGDLNSGFDRPGNSASVPGGTLIGPSGVVGSHISDLQLVGITRQAVNHVEQKHVITLTDGMNSAAPVGPIGQVMEKRKRGRPPKGLTPNLKPPPPKRIKDEEDNVCFICFDGGDLFLCDRKGCPKAYHPTCIKRDESFFQSRWNCGWHICHACQKPSHYKCYTCTFSSCKKCIKNADYVCVRDNNGLCAICMKTIMLIENEDSENKEKVDFDDKSTWEYLFKIYWKLLKEKLSLTVNELKEARHPARGVFIANIKPPQQRAFQISTENGAVPNVLLKPEIINEQAQLHVQNSLGVENPSFDKSTTLDGGSVNWASKELLEFVTHIKNGDKTVLSHFDVQELLMEYIKTNNLCDPQRKSQIICDEKLEKLFGKPCVGHIEMLKLLEYHFPKKDDTPKQSLILGGCADQVNNPVLNRTRRLKSRSRRESKTTPPQINMSDYAAIDVHNIGLIFLRRSMLANLIIDGEKFHDKAVGSVVRIKVSTNDQKNDMFRLVQVVGTGKGTLSYKVGDKMTDVTVDVLNLNKKETMSIDAISDQEFSEDECKRLRQSIKFGLVKRFTVGEIQRKAIALQADKLDDWLAAETLRLDQLRDQAMEKGRKKELRECLEKLQILKTPEEWQRRLCLYPEVHADPKMHPDYESENHLVGEDEHSRLRYSSFNGNGIQSIYPKRGESNAGKDDEPISSQQLQEKCNGGRLNTCLQQENHEPATVVLPKGDPPPINTDETENIWSYRDPSGKIQGPFSLVQLRKWTGYFPTDLTIWNGNEQNRCSVLLNDVLAGKIDALSQSHHTVSMQSREVGNAVDNTVQVLGNENAIAEHDERSVPLNLDINCQDSKLSEKKDDLNDLVLPKSVPDTYLREMQHQSSTEIQPTEVQGSVSIDINGKAMGVPDLSYPISNSTNLQKPSWNPISDEQPLPSKIPTENFGWNSASCQVQEIGNDWIGCSPNPQSGNLITAPNSNTLPNWLSMNEPFEFSTLGEESVSDLLAEYDAMESQSGLGSPTSAARCVDDMIDRNDCFSSIEDMSPVCDAAKSDTLSSTADIPFPSLAAVMDDLFGTPDADAFDPLKMSATHSTTSSEGETKSADAATTTTAIASPWEAGSDIHPSVPCTMSHQVMVSTTNMDAASWGSVQGNMNCVGPPPQNFVNIDWGVQNPETTWIDPNFNVVGWNNQQSRYGGGDRFCVSSRDWSFQGVDMGFGRGGSRSTWSRQSHSGGDGGGGGGGGKYSRQRVCKFYETGHCRKGATCDYLHP